MSVRLRIASWNIRKCIGTDRRRDPARILAGISALDADVIVLQEADRRFGPRAAALPRRLIEEHGGWQAVDFGVRPQGLGWHGNAMLVRRGMEWRHARPLDLPMLEPRGAVMAEVGVAGRWLRVIGVHLDLSGLWRRRQVRALIDIVERAQGAGGPLATALMGDFNQWTDSGAISEFAFHHMRILRSPPTYHSQRPVARLDRVVLSHDVAADACGTSADPLFSRASDHRPIWADIRLG